MDILNSIALNPVKKIGSILFSSQNRPSSTTDNSSIKPIQPAIKQPPFGYTSLPGISRGFLKIAAISGLTAVVMSAYGSHGYHPHLSIKNKTNELIKSVLFFKCSTAVRRQQKTCANCTSLPSTTT